MTTLRKKTSGQQPLPRRQSIHPGGMGGDGAGPSLPPPPRVRAKDKSKVESLMKRRYSTRGVPPPQSALEPFTSELSSRGKAAEASYSDNVHILLTANSNNIRNLEGE